MDRLRPVRRAGARRPWRAAGCCCLALLSGCAVDAPGPAGLQAELADAGPGLRGDLLPGADATVAPPELPAEEDGLPLLHLRVGRPVGDEEAACTVVYRGRAHAAEVKLRGQSSRRYPKPGYLLHLLGRPLDAAADGLPDRNHLALITPFDDNSYVRQKLAYDVWADLAATIDGPRLTPRAFFTVVYLDGESLGLFLAVDRVDDSFIAQQGFRRGGNLFKAVDHDANFSLRDSRGRPKQTLHQGYEKKEGRPPAGQAGAFDDLDALVAFTGGASDADFFAGVDRQLDEREFLDWFAFVHFLDAGDSAGKNAYLYHDPLDGRFRYSPWDLNQCCGQDWMTQRVPADHADEFRWANAVFARYLQHPAGRERLWARFAELRRGPLRGANLHAHLDALLARIGPAARRDWARWGDAYRRYPGWAQARTAAGDWTDFDGEIAALRRWIDGRERWAAAAYPAGR